jgi:hypothetical protein
MPATTGGGRWLATSRDGDTALGFGDIDSLEA